MTELDRDACEELDAEDPLAPIRSQFVVPEDLIYLDGNSLGVLPRAAPERVHEMVTTEWGEGLVRSWNDAGWFDKPLTVGDRIAPLIGASPGTVVVGDSTSVNLFKALIAALRLRPGRNVIVSDADNFPTDLYMIQGAVELLGGPERRLVDATAGVALGDVLDERVAVVVLSQVDYRTGALYDMEAVTRQVHDAGALMVWDLCHSAGALPVALEECGADFAIGCTYKYLNGGPGSPAYVFVSPGLLGSARQPLTGWMGHARPFEFTSDYEPAEGITQFVISTPPLVAFAPLEASLDVWEQVSLDDVRRKSLALTGLFMDLVDTRCPEVEVVTPRAEPIRGSQVSLRHPEGYAVMQALIDRGLVGDFRAPDLMRFGLTPLYVGYADVWDAVDTLRMVLESKTWREPRFQQRSQVT